MHAIARHKWYLSAVTFAVVAIGADFVSKQHAASGASAAARATAKRDAQLWDAAFSHAGRSGAWNLCGVGLAVVAIVCWGVSRWRGEAGRESVMVVLLGAYLLHFMVMV